MRAYADNVIVVLEPLPDKTASGIAIVRDPKARRVRTARVVSSGPGHYRARSFRARQTDYTLQGHTEESLGFVPNETKPGDRVVIDAYAGQDYSMDISVPRHNKAAIYDTIGGERGEFRIVREQEIHLILDGESRIE